MDGLDQIESPYTPLNDARRETRLLSIMGEGDKILKCDLHVVSLADDDMPQFTALSYVWGKPTLTEPILLNGQKALITPALHGALRAVKRHWRKIFPHRDVASFRLWADGLCINQSDSSERNHQVQMMSTLFSSAELVIGWLGSADVRLTHLALQTMGLIGEAFSLRRELRMGAAEAAPIMAVRHLLDSPYWTRIWIFQEAVLARRLVLACLPAFIHWDRLQQAVRGIHEVASASRKLTWGSGFVSSFIDYARTVSDSRGCVIINSIYFARIMHTEEARLHSWSRKLRVHTLAGISCELQATDPKDYVYGMIGLTGLDITPDYRETVPYHIAWMDYAKAWVSLPVVTIPRDLGSFNYCELGFMLSAGVGLFDYPAGCPSWVPHFVGVANNPELGADKLILPDGISADRGMRLDDGDAPLIEGARLKTRGVACRSIARITDLEADDEPLMIRIGNLLPYMIDFVSRCPRNVAGIGPLHGLTKILRNDFARHNFESAVDSVSFGTIYKGIQLFILIAKLNHYSESHEPVKFMYYLSSQLDVDSLNGCVDWLLSAFLTPSEIASKGEPTMQQFRRYIKERIQDADRDEDEPRIPSPLNILTFMALFETEDGHLGMCPRGAEVGDLMCVLAGGILPFILRRVDGGNYLNVGRCSLSTCMNGIGALAPPMRPTEQQSRLQTVLSFFGGFRGTSKAKGLNGDQISRPFTSSR
ncbi:heterokaryon incompatibility protein-domain-containing protein [Podospora aff. communis PSN243]|uniref:Heterokaryon incompatibility protein-domain-containing protein n=1 Tax=Podospora aff. communis PSN243 TaxID=3040156 RepID=A0AAV9G8M4_9PEZI|nr:heterokaryon incompatibility protein-domain-containing protein [Podospora aff. communis PSN243]